MKSILKKLRFFIFLSFIFSFHSCSNIEPQLECQNVTVKNVEKKVCFPKGKICRDPHGIGDGKPLVIDCFNSGSRMCHKNSKMWPECAGGKYQ